MAQRFHAAVEQTGIPGTRRFAERLTEAANAYSITDAVNGMSVWGYDLYHPRFNPYGIGTLLGQPIFQVLADLQTNPLPDAPLVPLEPTVDVGLVLPFAAFINLYALAFNIHEFWRGQGTHELGWARIDGDDIVRA